MSQRQAVLARARVRAPKERRKMNSLEARYADRLQLEQAAGRVAWWEFEPCKLYLADGTSYTPDFLVVYSDGRIQFVETKGRPRDDAMAKFKIAARLYDWAHWLMVTWRKGAWQTIYDR